MVPLKNWKIPPALFYGGFMIQATLRLFNAIQVDTSSHTITLPASKALTEDIIKRCIRNGYILNPAITVSAEMLNSIEDIIGISGIKANSAFHKSWAVIKDATTETLVTQQIMHYMTTYGCEALGTYQKEFVFIPNETLELPEIKDDIRLVIIKALTSDELLEKIIGLGSGIALSEEVLIDIMTIVKANDYSMDFPAMIANRELKARLYDHFGIVPSEPVEFLRHLISKLTDESLLIKNEKLIVAIKESSGKFLDELIRKAPENLASIFYRFKPLFLAMKSISDNKSFFNKLRKNAVKMHEPKPEDYLENVTFRIKRDRLNWDVLKRKLKDASIFRKIRLGNALMYRINMTNSIVYRVRNGKGWATDFMWDGRLYQTTQDAFAMVLKSIADDMHDKVNGKTFYIPSNVNYALPATEKQFTGNFPTGSYVSVSGDMLVGIHWMNLKNHRIDLDLAMISTDGKYGWDSSYRSNDRGIMFSGDVTDAPEPNGASELFYIRKKIQSPSILTVNNYTFSEGCDVPCKIIVANEKPESFGQNYMVDINKIVGQTIINITTRQTVLGLFANVEGQNRFYFANVSVGNRITSSNDNNTKHARTYLANKTINSIYLRDVLQLAGANIVDKVPENGHYDLSPEAISKETLIEILSKDKS